jgi:hypothetical protein
LVISRFIFLGSGMRVGRPVKPLPQPRCDYCGASALLVRAGDDGYPYRDDHGALWMCSDCQAWIGVFSRSTRNVPLGRLADARLRELKARLHALLEPLAQAKVRRDGCSIFEARAKGLRWVMGEIGAELPDKGSIHSIGPDECERVVDFIERFSRERNPDPSDLP